MQYAALGTSGLMVSRVAFGNSLTHGNQIDDGAARSCVHAALNAGITTFDTADAYAQGRAEELLGTFLAGQRRSDLVLCTKVGRSPRPGANEGRLSRKHIRDSAEASLRRLGTDYIDLYQAHRWDGQTPLEETVSAFADLVHSGKALYIGVSEWTAPQIRAAAALARELRFPLVSNQAQYSLLWRVIEGEVMPACTEAGVGQMVWSPLAGGVLTGKYRPGQGLPEGSRAAGAEGGAKSLNRWNYLDEAVLTAVHALVPLAKEAGLTPARLALAWVLRNPAVSCAVTGASRPDQLRDTLLALEVDLDDGLVDRVEAALAGVAVTDAAMAGRAPAPRQPCPAVRRERQTA
ncbi:aldo/keto reductase family protein [Streptomyces sp. NBC_00986]|uniref:aldo/keto reductase family protein n=1 Tax=Streptomyces sp. NBC_00986 TaxID=2903702 RepID=UPI00386750BF|nr:aldo/keto reductase family protein [Streptomyces sp. NBC_00986]WSX64505.1 aldo/keto reductase family protein [Streptomyces sp. NBC_00986]